MIVVVRHSLPVNGVEEGPGVLMVPARSQDRLERIVELVWVNLVITVSCNPEIMDSN